MIDREKIILILKIVILLAIPYEVGGAIVGEAEHIYIVSLFWAFASDQNISTRLFYNVFDILNVVLLIIPTLYFNLRTDDETPKDVVLKLGLATAIVTFLAVGIVSPFSLSAWTTDTFTPNVSWFAIVLYRFVMFLLIFLVVIPVLKQFESKDTETGSQTDDSSQKDEFVNLDRSQTLILLMMTFPFVLTVISAVSAAQSQTTLSIEGLGWSFFYHDYGYTNVSQMSWAFSLSSTFASLTTVVFVISLLFIFKLLEYLDRETNRLNVLLLGTLSMLPTSFLAVLDLLLTLSTPAVFISIPFFIIQFVGWKMMKEKQQFDVIGDTQEEKKRVRSAVINVPIIYVAISRIRRMLSKNV